jgi:hypothetical protein
MRVYKSYQRWLADLEKVAESTTMEKVKSKGESNAAASLIPDEIAEAIRKTVEKEPK